MHPYSLHASELQLICLWILVHLDPPSLPGLFQYAVVEDESTLTRMFAM